MAIMPMYCAAAEPVFLADAAEQFAERSLSLPAGSARAQSVDRQLPLGKCDSGWNWSFPYEARTTVQVSCTASPSSRRYVSMRYDATAEGNPAAPAQQGKSRAFVAASRDLPIGHVLSAVDLEMASELPKGRSLPSTLSDPSSLVGLALTRPIRRGEALGRADARASVVIKRNSLLTGWYAFPGGQVYAKLVALENGKAGDWIELENPQSGRKLKGLVLADGTVQISRQANSASLSMAGTTDSRLSVD